MTYRGAMEGWRGDEQECHGHCGSCEQCEQHYHQSCDEEYESWIDAEI